MNYQDIFIWLIVFKIFKISFFANGLDLKLKKSNKVSQVKARCSFM